VCAGELTLKTAWAAIQHERHAAYRKYVAAEASIVPRGMELEEEAVANNVVPTSDGCVMTAELDKELG
jgi:hypothetical protein